MYARFHLTHDVPVNVDSYHRKIIRYNLTRHEVTEFCQIYGS